MAESEWGTLVLAAPVAAALVARNIYPSWLLTFNHAVMEFGTRFAAYFFLLTDEYPTFERNSKVAVIFPDVEGGNKLNRWLPLVKWFLAIPLYLVGFFYMALTFIATVHCLGFDIFNWFLPSMGRRNNFKYNSILESCLWIRNCPSYR